MAEDRDVEFGTHLGFAKAHRKLLTQEKAGIAVDWGSSLIFVVPL